MPVSKLRVGQRAPPFTCKAVIDGRFTEVSLQEYTSSSHWLLLMFIPMAWSYVCPTDILAFNNALSEFLYQRTCAIIFVSTDSEYALRAWNATSQEEGGLGGVHVPLLSDRNHALCQSYGVLVEEEGFAERAMFIIDPKGMIRHYSANDIYVGRSVEEAGRLVDALMFTDEYGEGCPSNWKKGDAGLSLHQDLWDDSSMVKHRRDDTSSFDWGTTSHPDSGRLNSWSGTMDLFGGHSKRPRLMGLREHQSQPTISYSSKQSPITG